MALTIALFGLLLPGLDLWRSIGARQIIIEDDWRETANLAHSLARHTRDLVQAADAGLLQMRERSDDAQAAPPPAGAVAALDADGGRVAGSPEPALDNPGPILAFHRNNASPEMHISEPVRAEGHWVLALSRRIERAGQFAGVALTTLPLDELGDFYGSFDVGRDGVIGLLLPSGTLALRRSARGTEIAAEVSRTASIRIFLAGPRTGSRDYVAITDQAHRIGSYERLDEVGLVVLVAHGRDEVLAQWRADTCMHLLVSGTALAVFVVLGLLLARSIGRRQAAEERHHFLATYARDVVVCFRLDLTRLYISPSITSLTGWSVAESLACTSETFIPAADLPALRALIDRLKAGTEQDTAAFRYRCKDARLIWVEGRYQLVRDRHGVLQVIGNLRDVTAAKQAEEQLAAANRELSALAHTDALTGLSNRRRLDEHLRQECRRAAREEESLSLLMIDVDRFKLFNDTYGHQEGDRCLQAVAGIVAGLAGRSGDLTARYGGEEIAVLLPGTDLAGALELGERIRQAVAGLAIAHAGNKPSRVVTVSVGAASLHDGHHAGAGTALIARADAALYAAKHRGRNCLVTEADIEITAAPTDETRRLAAVARY